MRKIIFLMLACIGSQFLFGQNKQLTLNATITDRSLYPERMRVPQWIPGEEALSYCTADYQTLVRVNSQGQTDTIVHLKDVNAKMKERIKIPGLWGVRWVSSTTFYFEAAGKGFVYDLESESLIELFAYATQAANKDVHYASGKAAYTVGHNLYLSEKDKITPVTSFDNENIVAGQAIARSEYGITKGTFWSPNGNFLAFYEKDESNVADYPLLDITSTPGSLNSIKYPMAGQGSEISRVGIYHTLTGKTVYLNSTKALDDYMTNVGWDPSENFMYVAELNRATDHMKLNKYDAFSGDFIATLFEEKNDRWVEPEHAPFFPTGSKNFVWQSERDGFMNLYLYSSEGKLIRQLTKNKWVTKSIVGSDAKGRWVYFTGTGTNPTEMHLFKVNVRNGKQIQLTKVPGTHSPSVSESGNFFLDQYSSTTLPGISAIHNSTGQETAKLLVAANPWSDYSISLPEIQKMKGADGQTDLYARMIKPADFDASKKYPVLVYVYGGPHAQMVTNRWGGGAPLWMYYQANQGYIVFTVDNRGSANRGFAFESIIHRQLGEVEMEDQLAGVAYLKEQPFVDADRMAVHGWSYGGFMTSSLMLRHPGMFKVGVAGGPVTDWKYYEVMYGERYMDTPEENPDGYKTNSLMQYVENLKGDLLLIHGTVDDVVVMQHNLSLVKAFVDAGVQVDFFPYPMHPHNVRGKDRVHLMTKVLNYIDEKLK